MVFCLVFLFTAQVFARNGVEFSKRELFWVYATEGTDSKKLWNDYSETANVIKDYDALELTLVNTNETLLKSLRDAGTIEFFVVANHPSPSKHGYTAFEDVEYDGTNAQLGKGDDWYFERVSGKAFIDAEILGENVVLVVLDSGIGNPNHTLIKNNLEKWYDWVNYNGSPHDDTMHFGLSHGLACASEVTRSLPKIKVHMHKIHRAPNGENYIEDILEAYNQILLDKQQDSRPYVINQSYGLETLDEFMGMTAVDADKVFLEAEERLWKSSNSIFFTAASGNDSAISQNGKPVKLPGASPRVISVGSINWFNEISYFSNLGATVWAPGSSVQMARANGDNNAVGQWDGTSFAAPLVAANLCGILSFMETQKIPYNRDQIYNMCIEWTELETSKVHYTDKNTSEKNIITVEMRQINFIKTVNGLRSLIK